MFETHQRRTCCRCSTSRGVSSVENHLQVAVPFHGLLPVREKGLSETASLHDNLIVHGDIWPP